MEITKETREAEHKAHREHYRKFVNSSVKAVVLSVFDKSVLIEAFKEDKYLNSIPIRKWDYLANFVTLPRGNNSLAQRVCLLKEAARQIAEEEA